MDEPSFDSYVRARSDGLLRLAWLITRNWDDARDAIQDAFISLYPRWSQLPTGPRLESYVYRSAVNACLRVIRRRGAEPMADLTGLREAPITGDPTASTAESTALWRLCGELPPLQRAAVVLRFYQDLSFAEVAAAMGCRETTARSHVHRGLAALRISLKEEQS
jgi:RNA polymerase sigma-70 factor (sigma-E family)